MHGPGYLDDEELLRRSIMREDELEQTVPEPSELEGEQDEAREAASASRDAYEELEETGRSGPNGRTRKLASRLKVAVAGLVVLLVAFSCRGFCYVPKGFPDEDRVRRSAAPSPLFGDYKNVPLEKARCTSNQPSQPETCTPP